MNLERCSVPVVVLLAIALVLVCGLWAAPPAQSRVRVTDLDSLMEALRYDGVTVDVAGDVSQPFFSVHGQVVEVNGGNVQVFEYESEAAAIQEADLISFDGHTIGTSSVIWVARPHFYRAGRLIVLYVGDEEVAVAAVLGEVLGPPFAGGQDRMTRVSLSGADG